MRLHQVIKFEGTPEEKLANHQTHSFAYYEDEGECVDCFCKPWHMTANYPCGSELPRETIEWEVN